MLRLLGMLVTAVAMASCAVPTVYAPGDLEGRGATGRIEPLSDVLSASKAKSLLVVFVHGVGDHCAGYALDPKSGWLSDKTAAAIGLTPGPAATYQKILSPVFISGGTNTASYSTFGRRSFSLALSNGTAIAVDAVEITWSPTTQWLKSNYLGYDSASVTPRRATDGKDCITAENEAAVSYIKRPPSRLLLDRLIKERVFDRNLSDAIIYSGSYGEVIERAFADGLCRALVETPETEACQWSRAKLDPSSGRRFVFVTHSLGSRVVYDALLDLIDTQSPGRPNKFRPSERRESRPVVRQVITDTIGVLMMANQLSLLGLANAPPLARDDEGPKPLFVEPTLALQSLDQLDRPDQDLKADQTAVQGCTDPLSAIGQVKAQMAPSGSRAGADLTLRVTAFNDTNDLLTWHIPKRYASTTDTCRPQIKLANVFVRNTPPLLILENARRPRCDRSEALVHPALHEIEQVAGRVPVLAGGLLTGFARCAAVHRAVDHDEVLVPTRRHVEEDLAIPHERELAATHRGHQHRNAHLLQIAAGGIVARAPFDAVECIRRPNRAHAQERLHRQHAGRRKAPRALARHIRHAHHLDGFVGLDGAIVPEQLARLLRRVMNAHVGIAQVGSKRERNHERLITELLALDTFQPCERVRDQTVHAV